MTKNILREILHRIHSYLDSAMETEINKQTET